jgi:hypothetical protein
MTSKLNLEIDGKDLKPTGSIGDPKVYIYNGGNTLKATQLNLTGTDDAANKLPKDSVADRFQEDYIQNVSDHIKQAIDKANQGTDPEKWSSATKEALAKVITNKQVAIVCQIAIINHFNDNTVFNDNEMAVVQFPIYLRNEAVDAANGVRGGRRRTKANKGKSSYHTRKQKKQRGTK